MSKTYFNWSSGKDSSLALYLLLDYNKKYKVDILVTTLSDAYGRVSMHGLREDLLDEQAKSIGLPLQKTYLSESVSMEQYALEMEKITKNLFNQGYRYAAFGDIYLEDLRAFREIQLAKCGIKAVFPLWQQNTKDLMTQFLSLGFKAITVCVNAKLLDASFVGRIIDESFLNELPENVDPCGENGEFHTFVYDGPIFTRPISFEIGEKVLRTYSSSTNKNDDSLIDEDTSWDSQFWFCDLIPNKKSVTN
ncbi:MAG: diphthine--ammonia ligase [Flavobacteriaceae bacterium]|nr:diphthine--ammonia ligase [Flavobacteriaceae bacterium]